MTLIKNYSVVIILLISISCVNQRTLLNIETVTNNNIQYSLLPRGRAGSVMTIAVTGSSAAINLSHIYKSQILYKLLDIMAKDDTKDWAINIIMYDIFNRDALEILKSKNYIDNWRLKKKSNDIALWKNHIAQIKNN